MQLGLQGGLIFHDVQMGLTKLLDFLHEDDAAGFEVE